MRGQVEDPFGLPGLHSITKLAGVKPDYTDPRTGELKFKLEGGFERVPAAFTTDYPTRGTHAEARTADQL